MTDGSTATTSNASPTITSHTATATSHERGRANVCHRRIDTSFAANDISNDKIDRNQSQQSQTQHQIQLHQQLSKPSMGTANTNISPIPSNRTAMAASPSTQKAASTPPHSSERETILTLPMRQQQLERMVTNLISRLEEVSLR